MEEVLKLVNPLFIGTLVFGSIGMDCSLANVDNCIDIYGRVTIPVKHSPLGVKKGGYQR